MRVYSYSSLLLAGLTALLLGAPAARAEKGPDPDAGKWDPTEVLGPLTDVGELEPNNDATTANPFSCGDVLRPAAINTGGDFDFIVFTATTGQTIQFGTDADGASGQIGDTIINLIASDGTTVLATSDDEGPGFYSLLSYTATYTGAYYGKIRAFSATAVGGYKAFVACFDPIPPECDLTAYKGDTQILVPPVAIPDNTPAGVLVGTISTPPDLSLFLDVVVSLRMDHTWVGDLIATVTYDETCDGTPEASATILCRPGRATCTGGTGVGCSSNLSCNNNYFFSDAGAAEMGLPPMGCLTSTDVLPSGCWRPNATGTPLSVFDHLRKGGCFSLYISDNAAGDIGQVCEWGVYTLNEVIVPTERTSWGGLKARYGR